MLTAIIIILILLYAFYVVLSPQRPTKTQHDEQMKKAARIHEDKWPK